MSDYLDPRERTRAAREAERAARYLARLVIALPGSVMMIAAGYHFGGAWGVVGVWGYVLARPLRAR